MKARLRFLAATIVDEYRHMWRRKTILVVLLGIPVLYPMIVSWLYQANQVTERPAVIIDLDNSALSRRLHLYVDATQGVRIVDRVPSVEAGFDAIKRRRAEMFIYVPADFSARIGRGERSPIKVWSYAANILTYGMSYPSIHAVAGQLNAELATGFWNAQGLGSAQAHIKTEPITTDVRYLFRPTAAYGSFLVTAVLIIVMQQLILIGLSLAIGSRREGKALQERMRYPATFYEGVAIAQMAFYGAAIAFIVFFVHPLFDWPVQNSWSLVGLFLVFTLTMTPIAVIVANFIGDRFSAFQILMFLSAPILMMSGFAWPSDQMPGYVQAIAAAIPATPALSALRILSTKTGDLGAVAPHLGWMGIQFVAYLALAIIISRRSWRRIFRRATS